MDGYSKLSGEGEVNDRRDEELERALRMDGTIPGSSDAFVRQVSSRAYDMRHHLHQTFDTSSYDAQLSTGTNQTLPKRINSHEYDIKISRYAPLPSKKQLLVARNRKRHRNIGSDKNSNSMSGSEGSSGHSAVGDAQHHPAATVAEKDKKKEKARVNRTSLILWQAHQDDVAAVRKLLEEDRSLVHARDYDSRTPLHVAAIHGWIDVAKCLLEYEADVNAQDRWKNTPLADAEGAKRSAMIELLKSYGGLSYGQNGSHFEPRPVPPPLPNKCDWEIDPSELDFSSSVLIGKGSFGEIVKAGWRGTPVAVKRILPNLSDDRLVIQDFRHEVNLLVKLRHPNIVQFLGAVTDKKPLMLITEYLRGGDLHQYLKEKGALNPSIAINFALDIARGMAYLHSEPNVVIHRDLKPRNVLLVNSSADHLKVGDFGLSKLIRVQHSHDVYKMTGKTGSYRYMAPEVFKHRKYDKKVDVFSFAMILYEMLEGEPPMSHYEPYEAARYVAEGHRPIFRAKGLVPDLKELTVQCWAPDMNQRPSFLEILKKLEKIKSMLPSDHHWNIFTS